MPSAGKRGEGGRRRRGAGGWRGWLLATDRGAVGGAGVLEELFAVPKQSSGLQTASVLIQVRFLWAAQVDFWTWAKRKNCTPARPQESYENQAQSDFQIKNQTKALRFYDLRFFKRESGQPLSLV